MNDELDLTHLEDELVDLVDECRTWPDLEEAAELGRRLAALAPRALSAERLGGLAAAGDDLGGFDPAGTFDDRWAGFGDGTFSTLIGPDATMSVRDIGTHMVIDLVTGGPTWHVDVGEARLPGGFDPAVGGLDAALPGGLDPLRSATSAAKGLAGKAQRELRRKVGPAGEILGVAVGAGEPLRIRVSEGADEMLDVMVRPDGRVVEARVLAQELFEQALVELDEAMDAFDVPDPDDPDALPDVGGLSPSGRSLIGADKDGGGIDVGSGAAVGAVAGMAGAMAGRAVARKIRQPRKRRPSSPQTENAPSAAPAARICATCTNVLDDTARFCPNCGAAAPAASTSPVPGAVTEAAAPHPQQAVPTTAIEPEPSPPEPAGVAPSPPGVDTTMIFAAAGTIVDEPPPTAAADPVPAAPPPDPEADLTPPPPPPLPVTPAPAVAQPAPVTQPAPKPVWRCTHTVPSGGVWVWQNPDPAVSPTESLPAGVQLQFLEAKGSWWKMAGWNGWEGWVDGRLMVPAG